VSRRVVWAAGSGGTVLRTTDAGRTWQQVGPPGTTGLEFRDIEAFDAAHAVALTIGPGDQSRTFVTDNGGRTWAETFRNPDAAAFYDCLAFFDRRHGIAVSDPVDGKFRILSTADGGRHWNLVDPAGMPPALDGEFAFAASGTCLVTAGRAHPGTEAWLATGGGATARVLRTRDRGVTWTATDTPVPSGPSAGIYSLALRAHHGRPAQGIAVGGDYAVPTQAPNGAATSRDGGVTWTTATTPPGEYRSGVAWLAGAATGQWPAGAAPGVAVAVGPTGSDLSRDGGRTWQRFDTGSYDAVACTPDGACWATGEKGRAALLVT
jgi:photosystem II stability/assembly factor-like uncharacterized protein